jgi:hypothetical protein
VIGTIGSAATWPIGDGSRLTTPIGASIDWLVGAADGWHEPGAESGGRLTQQRDAGLPVVTTGLRVPGGQIVHRAWCVSASGGPVAVVELENRSRDAVAVALVVEAGPGGPDATFDGGRLVAAAGAPVLASARPVARTAAGTRPEVVALVTAGDAPRADGSASGPAIGLVLPLAHTARLRLALPGPGVALDPARIDALAGPDDVASGWRTHLLAGTTLGAPDPALLDAVTAARVRLLLGDADPGSPVGDAAAAALALHRWGHADAASAALTGVGDGGRRLDAEDAGALLAAWAAEARAAGPAAVEALVEPAARLAHRLGRGRRGGPRSIGFAAAQHDAAALLDVAGQHEAADLCRERAAAAHPAAVDVPADALATPPSVAAVAGGTRAGAARLLLSVAQGLAGDREPGALALLGRYPDAWLGQDLEVHRLATRAGLLSFALRWHGTRPALLWERQPPSAGGTEPVALSVPGLDGTWSSTHLAGEALLGPVEPAGGLPKVVAPLAGAGTPVDEQPDDGVSFT